MTMTDDFPPMLFTDLDIPRTHAADPITSHLAADRSQAALSATRHAVLALIRDNPGVIGSELNDLYHLAVSREMAPRAAWDSPRKRAGELVPFYVDVTGTRTGHSNTQEREFTINNRGIAALEAEK